MSKLWQIMLEIDRVTGTLCELCVGGGDDAMTAATALDKAMDEFRAELKARGEAPP